jgi:hypothetical protein
MADFMPHSILPNLVNTASPTDADTIQGDVDPTDLMVEVSLARYGVIQQDLQIKADEIKKNNALLTDYQNTLAAADAQISSDTTQDSTFEGTIPADVWAKLKDSGVPYSTAVPNADGSVQINGSGQKLAAWLKDKIQALSNNSQMDMIQLQSEMNNLNQTMDTATGIMQKAFQTKDTIIRNI